MSRLKANYRSNNGVFRIQEAGIANLEPISVSDRESKATEGEKGRAGGKSGEDSGKPRIAGPAAPGEPVSSPARRLLPGGAGLAGESAHGAGHT